MPKLVIPGGSGFLGLYLADYFSNKGWELVILSRSIRKHSHPNVRYVVWDGKTLGDWQKELDGAAALVNMAGRTVNCRYNAKNKAQILNSRIDSTQVLGQAIAACQTPPRIWINSSTATIYQDTRGDLPANDEYNGKIGDDFSMGVAKAWEQAFEAAAKPPATRKVALRTAIVLGKTGGVMGPLLNLVRWGLGGKQGPGNQFVSWLHVHDFARIIDFIIEQKKIEGVINAAAPTPVENKEFMRQMRLAAKVRLALPAAVWMLKIGAVLIKTETELILKSRKVVSKRLEELGFAFEYPNLASAYKEIISH